VATRGMIPPILPKRIFSRGVTDYFRKYFCMNSEFSLRVPDFICLGDGSKNEDNPHRMISP
jgi:hypothetical protein